MLSTSELQRTQFDEFSLSSTHKQWPTQEITPTQCGGNQGEVINYILQHTDY